MAVASAAVAVASAEDAVASIAAVPQNVADAAAAKAQEVVDDVKAVPGKTALGIKAGIEEQQQLAREKVEEAKRQRDQLRR